MTCRPHPETLCRLMTGGLLAACAASLALALTKDGWLGDGLAVLTAALAGGVSSRFVFWFPRKPAYRPVVLMLHSVSEDIADPNAPNNSIRPRELETLIDDLLAAGYAFRTLRDAMGGGAPRRTVVLTADDGYADNHAQLFPILRRLGVPATIFLTDARGGDCLTEPQIREMAASGLVEFGGHTVSHVPLTECDEATLKQEIEANRQALTSLLGEPVESFAYPYGRYGERERAAAEAAGYRYAVTTHKRAEKGARDDLLRIPRQILPRGLSRLALYMVATRGRVRW